jgi:hypothetical protein
MHYVANNIFHPFYVYRNEVTNKSRRITDDIIIGGIAALSLGFGAFFLVLSSGVYL